MSMKNPKPPVPKQPPAASPSSALSSQRIPAQGRKVVASPPVYRPEPPVFVQRKTASSSPVNTAPPVYRPPKLAAPAVQAKPGYRVGVALSAKRGSAIQRSSLNNSPLSLIASFLGGGDQANLEAALGYNLPDAGDLEEVQDYVPGPLLQMDNQARPVTVLKRTDWNLPAIGSANVILPGKMFYRFGDGPLSPLTAEMINAHWDARYGAPFVRIRGPEWRSNCGDYATGREGNSLGDVPDVWAWLNSKPKTDVKDKSAEELATIFSTLADGTYVYRFGYHFVRITLNGLAGRISQKDGDSGVYAADRTRQQIIDFVGSKNGLSGAALHKI